MNDVINKKVKMQVINYIKTIIHDNIVTSIGINKVDDNCTKEDIKEYLNSSSYEQLLSLYDYSKYVGWNMLTLFIINAIKETKKVN